MVDNRLLRTAALTGFGCAVALFLFSSQARADIYRYVDPRGTVHFTDKPSHPGYKLFMRSEAQPAAPTGLAEARAALRARPASKRSSGSREFSPLVHEASERWGVSPALVHAVITAESNYDPEALSRAGAMGLMQLMPATATEFGVVNPFDPGQNIGGGVRYLKRLLTRYDHKVELALAAYNAGPGAVDRYGQNVPPYRETRDYVQRITKVKPGAATGATAKPATRIYRWVEVVDGREVVRYSDRPQPGVSPSPGSH